LRCAHRIREQKSGPISGATIKRQIWKENQGKVMLGVVPKAGTLKRESSRAIIEEKLIA